MAVIGVLALQGGYDLHAQTIKRLGHTPYLVNSPKGFDSIQGIVLPGGESSVHLKLLDRHGMKDRLREFLFSGAPVLATCAGMILCAKTVKNPNQFSFACIDIEVARNAWGSQLDSFEAISDQGLPLMFIRAPRILNISEDVEVLESFKNEAVMVRQNNIFAASFHPEMSDREDIHNMVFGRLH